MVDERESEIMSYNVEDFLVESIQSLSLKKSCKAFNCSLCGFESGFKAVVKSHIRVCMKKSARQYFPEAQVGEHQEVHNIFEEDYFWN